VLTKHSQQLIHRELLTPDAARRCWQALLADGYEVAKCTNGRMADTLPKPARPSGVRRNRLGVGPGLAACRGQNKLGRGGIAAPHPGPGQVAPKEDDLLSPVTMPAPDAIVQADPPRRRGRPPRHSIMCRIPVRAGPHYQHPAAPGAPARG